MFLKALDEVRGESFQYSLLRNCLQTRQFMMVRAPARTRTLERQPWSCELSLLLGKMTSSTHFETMHQEAHALTCNKNAMQLFVCQCNAVLWPMTMILKPSAASWSWNLTHGHCHCLTIIKKCMCFQCAQHCKSLRDKNKKRQEQLASHAGCQLNAYIASNIFFNSPPSFDTSYIHEQLVSRHTSQSPNKLVFI